MVLHGSTEENLSAAVRSARRLRGHHVYPETLKYWEELLHYARQDLPVSRSQGAEETQRLILELESELADRAALA